MAKSKKKKNGDTAGGNSKSKLKMLAANPMIADVVAAALVATASALRDSGKARQLAENAGDELSRMTKSGARRGEAMWDMALKIGRDSLEALAGEIKGKPAKRKAAGTKKSASPPKAAGKKKSAPLRKPVKKAK